ncbi:hypothetical protein EAH76_23245 [Sphingomonas glacialis]|uniref:DUF2306 domain-containing protein n=2 Tax=Sphingomonas glacialis TaxID=658225 RepID=A0A502FAV0_9SPHN|nr:hypothetical protein EAH76_23245 [Sphingomonas glacialis]
MSLAMAAVFISGFGNTVPNDFIGTPALPLLLHVHGAVFTLWVMLFVAQPAFIARGSITLHRKIGWLGVALAAAMLIMGVAATLFTVHYGYIPSFLPPAIFLVMNLVGIAVFAGLIAAGIALRKRSEWHKRLMLGATVSILGPGLGRLLPMPSFGAAAPVVLFGVGMLFALAGPVVDLIVRRRVHPAYYWVVGTIAVSQLAIAPLAFSPIGGGLLAVVRAQ